MSCKDDEIEKHEEENVNKFGIPMIENGKTWSKQSIKSNLNLTTSNYR